MSKRVKLRPELSGFACTMETVLRKNDDKGGWSDESPSFLLARLLEETAELLGEFSGTEYQPEVDLSVAIAMVKHAATHVRRSGRSLIFAEPPRVLRESADVANFAMMIADNFGDDS